MGTGNHSDGPSADNRNGGYPGAQDCHAGSPNYPTACCSAGPAGPDLCCPCPAVRAATGPDLCAAGPDLCCPNYFLCCPNAVLCCPNYFLCSTKLWNANDRKHDWRIWRPLLSFVSLSTTSTNESRCSQREPICEF